MNSTTIPHDHPLYYSPRERLVDDIPDYILTLAVPLAAYWSLSLFFHFLDVSGWKWLDKYRIHESEEVKKHNLVGRREVVMAVLFQQLIQTLLGYVWLEEEAVDAGTKAVAQIAAGLQKWEISAGPVVELLLRLSGTSLEKIGAAKEQIVANVAYFMYWWAVPCFQLLTAMFFIDTWQYFLHRLMHVNKFLYKAFHSWHHRLYVPYAFGSLYNHPVEGFLLDTLGAALAEYVTGMSTRQAMLLFGFSTFKTVDDHCGYNLPFDPLQLMTGNNADYHDIHHQIIGIKSNFAQPFFVHWDTLLGTKMTREELNQRKKTRSQKTN